VFADAQAARAMGAEGLRIVDGLSYEQNVRGLRVALAAVRPGFAEEHAVV